MSSSKHSLHSAALQMFRVPAARRAAFRLAAARGRSMALVYHRITPNGAGPHDIPPNLSVARFREHLTAIRDVADIVPLTDLLQPAPSRRRVRVAITFDDDERCHLDHALPALRSLGAPATFFLNGRMLNGAGAYWWMRLEQLIADQGVAGAARGLGVSASTAKALGAACESAEVATRLEAGAVSTESLLDAAGIRELVRAGMQIGFHTLHHPVLTTLTDSQLDDELRAGRARLADVAGAPMDLLAYPYGRANAHVAARAAAAGYRAAFRMGGVPISAGDDPFLLGRLGPSDVPAGDLLALIALRFTRTARPPAGH